LQARVSAAQAYRGADQADVSPQPPHEGVIEIQVHDAPSFADRARPAPTA
jgi:hypothetical protein